MTDGGWHVRVGTDVQAIAEVESSLARFGARYTHRLFTEHEVSSCGGVSLAAASGLAARFAAKEATIKVLRPTDIVPRWRSIEVRRQPEGWVELHLFDEAAELAESEHIGELSVSLSHGAGIGTATVVALSI